MTDGGDAQIATAKPEGQRPPRLTTCFLIVGVCWLALLAAGHLVARIDLKALATSWLLQGIGVLVLAGLGALAWEFRRLLMRTVTSLQFSAALIAALLVFTAIGTVIPQQAAPQAFAERHGALTPALRFLGMDDLFHTGWFGGLLAMFAVSLVLTAIEKRAYRVPMWGHMLSHLGFVTILLGGFIGSQYGFKGMLDLHEGQVVREVRMDGGHGAPAATRPLGFGVKLERFALETYAPAAKFYVYEREEDGYRPIRSFDLEEAATKRAIGASGAAFRLVAAYPDFYLKPEVREAPAGTGKPVLQVDFKQGDWTARAALQAGIADADTTALSAEGPEARFIWATPDDAEIARLAEGSAERQVIALLGAGAAEEVAVAVGGTYAMGKGAYEVKVVEYLPDFSYDTKAKKAISRSQQPNNPAMNVRIRDAKTGEEKPRWLYAKMPDFGHGDGDAHGPKFVFRHQPATRPAARGFLILGEARQLWRLENGRVAERLPLEQWQTACAGLPVAGMQVHPSATIELVPSTRSQALENPAADIVVEEGGASRDVRMTTEHGQPVALADGKTFLSFELRANEPKTFQSHLTIIEDGKNVAEKTIVVNDPLSYKGHMFYQSNFRKDDPTYSGIQVVRDPGLGIVFIGFVMMSLGAVFIYYIRPRLLAGETHGH